ncbi:ROK family protein [Streptomyces sp. NPDC048564]|uniref:ROK family transcriptional regulator n=1 Tax=Streptomyces sp. NPDC048564 TaxID=3155760 RepID=UPI0034243E5B
MTTRHGALVLHLLRRHGPLTRGRLGALSGLSRTTLYDVVAALLDEGAVLASVPQATLRKRGRPAEVLALNPEAGNVLGIEFARDAVRVAARDASHEIVGTAHEPHSADVAWPVRVDLAWRLADALTGGTLRSGGVNGIGVGMAGPVERSSLLTVRHGGVAELVRERFGTPAPVDHAARLAALAETVWGAAMGARDVLYLRLSHDVGGGLVVAGRLHRGAHGIAGQFGHITVDPDGARCECGKRGCLETVASVGAVLNACRSVGGPAMDLPELEAALGSGDRTAHSVVARAGAQVGRVLADMCHAVGPDVIVVGGELVAACPAVMESIAHELASHAVRGPDTHPEVRSSRLGSFAAALGAVALHRQRTSPTSLRHSVEVGIGAQARADQALGEPLRFAPERTEARAEGDSPGIGI